MLSRNLRIALGISILLHISLMSTIIIVPPKSVEPNKAFTKVEFLGPILAKTAFDIMLENAVPMMKTTYSLERYSQAGVRLKAESPGKIVLVGQGSLKTRSSIDMIALGFLTANKTVPNFLLEMADAGSPLARGIVQRRRVINMPDAPIVEDGLYGDKTEFRIIMRVLVNAEGNVKTSEPATTTGYPELDIIASNFVKRWTFEPKESIYVQDEWITQEIVITTKGHTR